MTLLENGLRLWTVIEHLKISKERVAEVTIRIMECR